MTETVTGRRDVFLCHASEDKPAVKSVALGLNRYYITCWLDEAEMRPGDVLIEKISYAISMARKFCVFLSPISVTKPWVKQELFQAMHEEITKQSIKVIPVLLHDCEVPPFLRPKLYVDLRNWDKFGLVLQSLAEAIAGDIKDLPKDFSLDGLDSPDASEQVLRALPLDQRALEYCLRDGRWISRSIGTMRNHTGLTLKQVITYCEVSPHILLNPESNSRAEIYYGLKWNVMKAHFSEAAYQTKVFRCIEMISDNQIPLAYPRDVLDYFLSFHTNQQP